MDVKGAGIIQAGMIALGVQDLPNPVARPWLQDLPVAARQVVGLGAERGGATGMARHLERTRHGGHARHARFDDCAPHQLDALARQ